MEDSNWIVKTLAGLVVFFFGLWHTDHRNKIETIEKKLSSFHEVYARREEVKEGNDRIMRALERIEDRLNKND